MELSQKAKDVKNEYMRTYRAMHKEEQRIYFKEYRDAHKDQVKESNCKYWESKV